MDLCDAFPTLFDIRRISFPPYSLFSFIFCRNFSANRLIYFRSTYTWNYFYNIFCQIPGLQIGIQKERQNYIF